MAKLPPIWDPAKAVDRLPQPFRMIDKILAEVIETALDMCLAKDRQKRVTKATHIDTVISPHAVLLAHGETSCFSTLGVAGMAIVGTTSGWVMSHTARDPLIVSRLQAHPSAVTALDVGHVAATGTKVVMSASRTMLVVHDVVIKTSELRLLAQVELPVDPRLGPTEAPVSVSFSTNAGHAAVCYACGAVAVYEVNLPPILYDTAFVDRPPDAPPPDLGGGQLLLKLHFNMATIQALLLGNSRIGACNVVWRQQQRPDKSGKSDRNHRAAKGVYMWWEGCNKLALSYLDGVEDAEGGAGGVKLPPIKQASQPPPTPPADAKKPAAKPVKGKPVTDAVLPDPPPLTPNSSTLFINSTPSKGWLLPMSITSSCSSENGKMLAFGLNDGSTLVWDDHFGGHTRILARMPSPITTLAFVNGAANLLFLTSQCGSVYLADLNKPEDSHMSKTKLPHAAKLIYFLPNDPFAILVCQGDNEQQPRLVWFNMADEKLVAELSGKNARGPEQLGFGRAGMLPFTPIPSSHTPPPLIEGGGATGTTPPPSAPPPAAKAVAKAGSALTVSALTAPDLVVEAAATAAAQAAAQAAQAAKEALPWPMVSFRESYLVVGGPMSVSAAWRPPDEGPSPPDEEIPRDAHLYLYKIDAIARMLLPEEMASNASKSLLNRMLADLNPPKIRRSRVKMGVPDPDAPKPPPSALRKKLEDDAEMIEGRRHIKFNESDLEGLLNEEQGKAKLFKKETIKGGYSDGRSKQIADPSNHKNGIVDLSAFGGGPAAMPAPIPIQQERPQSPPWHHTNPLARIHPDWEEAGVLARIMEKLGTKGGGRRRRERRLGTVAREMQGKMAKEGKPALVFQ